MERREEAETYHPAVHTQRRQQIVRTLDQVLRVPLIAQHYVLRGVLAFRLQRRLASRNTPSVVRLVCRRGGRSDQAALGLESMGFTHVASMTGGMESWRS